MRRNEQGVIPVFDHICNDESVLAVTFRWGVVSVFLVLFDEVGVNQNNSHALSDNPASYSGAIVATIAIFLPAYLLIIGVLPFWNSLRKSHNVQGALVGINAAVVGILLAALYNPLWKTAIMAPADFALASILFIMLVFWKLPPWVVVIAGIVGGILNSLVQ